MKTASTGSKVVPLVCLIVVFAISLAVFLIRDRRYVDTLPGLIQSHRNVASVTVQILSTLLSMAQILVICSLINFAARVQLFRSPTSIADLSFWSALSIPQLDVKLPIFRLVLVVLMLALGPGLGALWTGSITPLATTTLRNDGQISVPFFNLPINRTMYPRSSDGAIITQCAPAPQDPRGTSYPVLDTCIVNSKLGPLIATASTATNITNPSQHPKIDNSTWTYRGRSYGKGSSTGLYKVTGTADNKTADRGYSYEETGWLTNVTCQRQTSTIFPFEEYYTPTDGTQVSLRAANTVVLDSANMTIPPFYVATPIGNGYNSAPFGYFAWTTINASGKNYLATSATNWTVNLDKILCTFDFTPMVFQTNVSTPDQIITITPVRNADQPFNQTGNVTDAILSDLDLLSRMTSSSLATSALENAININNVSIKLLYPDLPADKITEMSLEHAIIALADDLLTYQGILAVARENNESVEAPVQRHFAAIKIGQARFSIAQFAFNLALCVVYLIEAARTRAWKNMPAFNFAEVKALALAALGPLVKEMIGDENGIPEPASHSPSGGKATEDETKLVAFYDEQSKPRLCYAEHVEGRSQRSGGSSMSADKISLHPTGGLGASRSSGPAVGGRDSRATSYTSLRPLLASGDP